MNKHDRYRSNAIFAALSGAAQTALGFANINGQYTDAHVATGLNIGIGLGTFVTSVMRLARKNPPKENALSVNFIYVPLRTEHAAFAGVSLKKQF